MKKIALAIIVSAALYIVACSLEDCWPIATTDPDSINRPDSKYQSCTYVLMKHSKQMIMKIHLECAYDRTCKSSIEFGPPVGEKHNDCNVAFYEYEFVTERTRKKIYLGNRDSLDIYPDNHVNFSLFDTTGAEKKYDIDLSAFASSYMLREDSADILMPDYAKYIAINCPAGNNLVLCNFDNDSFANKVITVGIGGGWGPYFYMESWINYATEYGADSILISSKIDLVKDNPK